MINNLLTDNHILLTHKNKIFVQMKKQTLFAYFCAFAMVSAGLSSCKKDEPRQNVQSVSTNISMSLPTQVGNGVRRMPSATVQNAGATDFEANGMVNMTLIPFAKGELSGNKVTSSSTRLGSSNIDLVSLANASAYNDKANGRNLVYADRDVPMGTAAFLFYGKSGKTGTKFETGSLNVDLTVAPSALTFELEPILANISDVTDNAAYKGLIAYLNHVANAKNMKAGDPGYVNESSIKAWKEIDEDYPNEGLYELFGAYSETTYLTSFGIRRMMNDLYRSLLSVAATDSLAKHICDSIADGVYATVNMADTSLTLVSALQNFPSSLNLPEGSVAVAYSAGRFDGNAAHAFGDLAPAQLDRYVYPASLWYYANSRIKTSADAHLEDYTGTKSWAAILSEYEKDNGSVSSKTRSIALKDTIQYGVARLDVHVKLAAGSSLEDNNPVTTKRSVTNPAGGYTLTAVLIGGQKNAQFDFTPVTGEATVYTIYDKEMPEAINVTSSGYTATANSTLVLETAANEAEYIAIELVNTGKDFYGADAQLVPAGGKFYLVGQLSESKLAAGETDKTGGKIFKQDYKTTARLTVGDLKHAYSTIPDLKSPQLEVGLSVDLQWSAGNVYDVTL